ncbi:MAG: glycosyltransferase family 2 protein [Syntrophales bacterium]|nr:glycosyltransferase family 2 protein [Syntrophales bacterium]
MMKDIDCSIIIPVYFNEETIHELYDILEREVIKKNDKKFEVIFIDDGSGDQSLKKILELWEKKKETIRVIKLTRNFGQVPAMMAGYHNARGRCIINISADLQDPPELINDMLLSYYEEGYEIVVSYREARDESLFRTLTSRIFYKLTRILSFPNMPSGGFDYGLVGDKAKQHILLKTEANPFWQGQVLWTGFRTKFIPYTRRKREQGKSKWSLSKKIKYLIDGIMSFSYFPLRMMSVFGIITAICGFVYAVIVFIARIFGNVPFKGWAPLMIVVLVLSGIQMLMLGTIGEYIWRALDQSRGREPYIIEKMFDQ